MMMKRRLDKLEQLLKQTAGATNEEYTQAMRRTTEDVRNKITRQINAYLDSEAVSASVDPALDRPAAEIEADNALIEEYKKVQRIPQESDATVRARFENRINTLSRRLAEDPEKGQCGMNSNGMKEIIIDYIKEKNHVSFIEIERLFQSNDFEYKGHYCINPNPEYKNVMIWSDWNQSAVHIIADLIKDKLVEMEPTEPMLYVIDGGGMNLPLVKKSYDYKTPHWLPIVLVRVN